MASQAIMRNKKKKLRALKKIIPKIRRKNPTIGKNNPKDTRIKGVTNRAPNAIKAIDKSPSVRRKRKMPIISKIILQSLIIVLEKEVPDLSMVGYFYFKNNVVKRE